MELTRDNLMPRVERGAAWLDVNRPGWAECVDPLRLELSNCHACVIGQLDGDYCDTMRLVHGSAFSTATNTWATLRGFSLPFSISAADLAIRVRAWELLRACWETAILQRRFDTAQADVLRGDREAQALDAGCEVVE